MLGLLPVCVCLSSQSIVSLACGSFHTAALTERGQVLTWGSSLNGQKRSKRRLNRRGLVVPTTASKQATDRGSIRGLTLDVVACFGFVQANAATATLAM